MRERFAIKCIMFAHSLAFLTKFIDAYVIYA